MKTYNYMDRVLDIVPLQNILQGEQVTCYATELFARLGYSDWEFFKTVITRAMHSCIALDLPLENNFRPVFRQEGDRLVNPDWELSPLACFLVSSNEALDRRRED
jgi:hypothetical protein